MLLALTFAVAVQTAKWALGFTLVVAAAAGGFAEERSASAADPFPGLRAEPLTQYRAYRRMHARADRLDKEGWLEAWTELDAHGFRYEIVSERGSEHVRNKVLKALLQREQEFIATGESARSALTTANYDFSDAGVQESGVRAILLKPKRKDTLLVDGRMVLSPDGREVLRIEGRLSKNPSFWTSLVDVIRYFTLLNGARVPIATESVANIKLVGKSRMDVRYEYESVNGRPVSLAARQMAVAAISR